MPCCEGVQPMSRRSSAFGRHACEFRCRFVAPAPWKTTLQFGVVKLAVAVGSQNNPLKVLIRKKCVRLVTMPSQYNVFVPGASGPAPRNVPGAKPLLNTERSSHWVPEPDGF